MLVGASLEFSVGVSVSLDFGLLGGVGVDFFAATASLPASGLDVFAESLSSCFLFLRGIDCLLLASSFGVEIVTSLAATWRALVEGSDDDDELLLLLEEDEELEP